MKQQWHLIIILFMLCAITTSAYAVENKHTAEATKATVAEDSVTTAEENKQPKDIFDKNNDGIIDATDWKQMNEVEKRAYTRKLIIALGQDPDSTLGGLGTREEQYLKGLKAQFEEE